MPEVPYISLSELLSTYKAVVEEAFQGRYWVKGEITVWTPRANGHCYLDLAESRAGPPERNSPVPEGAHS